MENKNKNKFLSRSFAVSTYLGLQFAIVVFLFGYLGYYIDGKLDKAPLFLIILGLFGFIVGFVNIIRKVK